MENRTKELKTTPRKLKQKFSFEPPQEAPVFTPTPEEFENPLEYINKIRTKGEKTGICKIIPPASWKPPFVLDKRKLKFTPRIQRINELEARTRIKLNFIDQLTKFFALKGKTFQIPVVEKTSLDLYTLHRLVKEYGGPEEVSKEKKWSEIATQMGFTGKTAYTFLKHHYEHLIHPFLLSQRDSGKAIDGNSCSRNIETKSMTHYNVSPVIRKKDELDKDGFYDDNSNCNSKVSSFRELRSLEFLGPGPKMAVCEQNIILQEMKSRTRGKKISYEFDPLSKYMCKGCSNGDIEESLITCISCQDRYHSSCLIPALTDVPEKWRCPKCVAAEAYKPLEDFGFAQAEKEYSLLEFQAMANDFKKSYFKTEDPTSVPTSRVEEEFWRVVSSIDEAVTVEYGADLHVIDHGSAFPRKNQPYIDGIDKNEFDEYAKSAWNLNNLPVLTSSVLKHISADISGMKIPWMYAGMCFATFCWHNEDHWSYSINYLHLGEPKTWYGVSGHNAEKFEKAMQSAAPELFAAQPDLLHHLVTIMNPNDLMSAGVPVYRTDQREGEFVITFPRAYHAGFNQGFNFAEACNFAPYDWLQIGRECISHYSSLKRPCVFSHDELVCNMAIMFDELETKIAEATVRDMTVMVNAESKKLNRAIAFGVKTIVDYSFESLPDDERQCCECNTTVFLSAVVCPCDKSRLVCLEHVHKLCGCKPCNYLLKCSFRVNFLMNMVDIMKAKIYRFDEWRNRVQNALHEGNTNKISLRALTELLIEAKEREFPQSELIDALEAQVRKSIDCSALARVIVGNSVKKNIQNKLTIEDISMFYEEIESLPCTLSESGALKKILDDALKFQRIASVILSKKAVPKSRVASCIKLGKSLDLELTELPLLEKKLADIEWLATVEDILTRSDPPELDVIKSLLDSSVSSTNTNVKHKREELLKHFENVKALKEKCNRLSLRTDDMNEVENILTESEQFNLKVPDKEILMVKVNQCRNIKETIGRIVNGQEIFYLSELESLISKGKAISSSLKCILELEEMLLGVKRWLGKAKTVYLKRNTPLTLMQALWPRNFKHRSVHFQRVLLNNVGNLESLIEDNQHSFSKSDFNSAFEEQVASLQRLRLANLKHMAEEDSVSKKQCICGEEMSGYSIVCVLCKTSFHISCFKIDGNILNSQIVGFTTKNLCSFCTRTKRPSIETIEALYVSSQQLKIQVPECLALEYTLKALKDWQKDARTLLSSKEMIAGLNNIVGNMKETCSMKNIKTKDSWLNYKRKLIDDFGSQINPKKRPRLIPNINLQANVNISSNGRIDLRQLMIVGDSFEASSQESEQLWILLDACQMKYHQDYRASNTKTPSEPATPPPPPPTTTTSTTTPPPPINVPKIITKLVKSKAKKLNTSPPGGLKKQILKAQKSKSGKLRKIIKKNGLNPVTSPTVVSPQKSPQKRKKRIVKTLTTKTTPAEGTAEGTAATTTESWEEHEEGDICAAALNCLQPSDDNVNWVQCDGDCGQWFHMKCVDWDIGKVKADDEFKCLRCKEALVAENFMPPFKPIKLPCLPPSLP